MQVGIYGIQRVAEDKVTNNGGAEIVARDFIEERSFDGESQHLKWEVLPVNTAAPIMIADTAYIIVVSPPIGSERAYRPLVGAEVACGWWRWSNNFLGGSYSLTSK